MRAPTRGVVQCAADGRVRRRQRAPEQRVEQRACRAQRATTTLEDPGRAGTLGGDCGSSSRWVTIFSITGRPRMAAMILSFPLPQIGKCCISMSNTRLSTRAQRMLLGRT